MSQQDIPVEDQSAIQPGSGNADRSGEWSRKRAFFTGVVVGLFFGLIFFTGYAFTSAWICSASLNCGHWAPIAIVSGSGVVASGLLGGIGGYILHRLYNLFRVV